MATIVQWDSSFSVGNEVLDRQHQQLLGLCNELARHSRGEQPVSRARFHEILNELSNYARQHFKTEETLLKQRGYAEVATQEAEHLAYDEKVAEWSFDATLGDLDLPQAHDYLAHWWKDHILGSDMKYRALMEATS